MTDRRTPVGSCGGAEAILVDMSVEITDDDVIGDVAGSGGEVAGLPEALAPVAFADVLELLLDFAKCAALGSVHEDTGYWTSRRLKSGGFSSCGTLKLIHYVLRVVGVINQCQFPSCM